ncbi:uncharacterized protein [Hetaerina americana]|uniref:uncharacterized protein n=1 Tax=Hetaerina americana TaxID=62018 RepID=UPI003A7F30F7
MPGASYFLRDRPGSAPSGQWLVAGGKKGKRKKRHDSGRTSPPSSPSPVPLLSLRSSPPSNVPSSPSPPPPGLFHSPTSLFAPIPRRPNPNPNPAPSSSPLPPRPPKPGTSQPPSSSSKKKKKSVNPPPPPPCDLPEPPRIIPNPVPKSPSSSPRYVTRENDTTVTFSSLPKNVSQKSFFTALRSTHLSLSTSHILVYPGDRMARVRLPKQSLPLLQGEGKKRLDALLGATCTISIMGGPSHPRSPAPSSLPPKKPSFSFVVKGVDLQMQPEDIKEALVDAGVPVVNLWRITSRATNTETTLIRCVTTGAEAASAVISGGLPCYGRVYRCEPSHPPLPQPQRCFRCQQFGHPTEDCRLATKCARCGAAHRATDCTATAMRCPNCSGEHHAGDWRCPKRPSAPKSLATTAPILPDPSLSEAAKDDVPEAKEAVTKGDLLRFLSLVYANAAPEHRQTMETILNTAARSVFGFNVRLVETFLPPNARINIPNFQEFSKPRVAPRSGGVSLLVRKDIGAKALPIPSGILSEGNEAVLVECRISRKTIFVCSLYSRTDDPLPTALLSHIISLGRSCIILGDFNARSQSFRDAVTTVKGRRQWLRTRDPDLKTEWNRSNAIIRRRVIAYKEKSWAIACSKLDSADGAKFWKQFRALSGQRYVTQTSLINSAGDPIAEPREKAEEFRRVLSDVFRPQEDPAFDEGHKAACRRHLDSLTYSLLPLQEPDPNNNDPIFLPIDTDEMAECRPRRNTAPGNDGITTRHTQRAPSCNQPLLLIFNSLLSLGYYPTAWKSMTIIMLPKPGKDRKKAENYRPICLTSVIGKWFERIITRRLTNLFSSNGVLPPHQYGFRPHRCTTDPLSHLTTMAAEAINCRQYVAALFLDIERAFDGVWAHVANVTAKCSRRANLLRAVRANGHGVSEGCGVLLYKAFVRPVMEYAALAVLPLRNNLERFASFERRVLRRLLLLPNDAPREYIYDRADIEPILHRLCRARCRTAARWAEYNEDLLTTILDNMGSLLRRRPVVKLQSPARIITTLFPTYYPDMELPPHAVRTTLDLPPCLQPDPDLPLFRPPRRRARRPTLPNQ